MNSLRWDCSSRATTPPTSTARRSRSTAASPRRCRMRGSRSDWLGAVIARSPCDEAIHSFFTRRDGLLRFARNDDAGWVERSDTHQYYPCADGYRFAPPILRISNTTTRSRGAMRPKFCISLSLLENEGAGKTGCALHPRSRVQCASRNAHTSIQVQRRTPGLPCAMALRLIRVRPGDRLSCHHRQQRLSPPRDLTPAPGRQAHTISPYAIAALVSRRLRVHRIPPHGRDDRDRPSCRGRRAELNH